VITGRVPGAPHSRYNLAAPDRFALPHQIPDVVGVQRIKIGPVIYDDQVPISA
jgi:hypothetical protein